MRAMILAAGRGKRMGSLTMATPKPLLLFAGVPLIEHVILRLKSAGIQDIIINVSYLGEKIKTALGNGSRYQVNLIYSEEEEVLETGGGILKALPLLGDHPFLVVSSDIITNYPFHCLPKTPTGLAHLVLVKNPSYNSAGDFGLNNGLVDMKAQPKFTYANIGLFRPELFIGCEKTYFPLNHLLFPAIERGDVSGEYFSGTWYNIGTQTELLTANQLSNSLFSHPLVS